MDHNKQNVFSTFLRKVTRKSKKSSKKSETTSSKRKLPSVNTLINLHRYDTVPGKQQCAANEICHVHNSNSEYPELQNDKSQACHIYNNDTDVEEETGQSEMANTQSSNDLPSHRLFPLCEKHWACRPLPENPPSPECVSHCVSDCPPTADCDSTDHYDSIVDDDNDYDNSHHDNMYLSPVRHSDDWLEKDCVKKCQCFDIKSKQAGQNHGSPLKDAENRQNVNCGNNSYEEIQLSEHIYESINDNTPKKTLATNSIIRTKVRSKKKTSTFTIHQGIRKRLMLRNMRLVKQQLRCRHDNGNHGNRLVTLDDF